MADDTKRGSKGLWIPIELLERTDLTWIEKGLLAEITWYGNLPRGCIASNKTLGRWLGINEKTVANLLWKLRAENEIGPNDDVESRNRKLIRTGNQTHPGTGKGRAGTLPVSGKDPSRKKDGTLPVNGTVPIPVPGTDNIPGDNREIDNEIDKSGSGNRAEAGLKNFIDKKPTKEPSPSSSFGNVANGNRINGAEGSPSSSGKDAEGIGTIGANGTNGGTSLIENRGEAPTIPPQGPEPQNQFLIPPPPEMALTKPGPFLDWYEEQCRTFQKEPFDRKDMDFGLAKGVINGFGHHWNTQTVRQVVQKHFQWAKGQKDVRMAQTVKCLLRNLPEYLAPILAEETARKEKVEHARRIAEEAERPEQEKREHERRVKEQQAKQQRDKEARYCSKAWGAFGNGLKQISTRFGIIPFSLGDPRFKGVFQVLKTLEHLPEPDVMAIFTEYGMWKGNYLLKINRYGDQGPDNFNQYFQDKLHFLGGNPDIAKRIENARSATNTTTTASVAVSVETGMPMTPTERHKSNPVGCLALVRPKQPGRRPTSPQ